MLKKIVRVEVITMSGHTEHVGESFIEAGSYCAERSTPEVMFYLDDGSQIVFHDTDCSNGENTVEITLRD